MNQERRIVEVAFRARGHPVYSSCLLTVCLLPWQVELWGWGAGTPPVQASIRRVLPGPGPHSGPGAGGTQYHACLRQPR